jgi:hypothetical protein
VEELKKHREKSKDPEFWEISRGPASAPKLRAGGDADEKKI